MGAKGQRRKWHGPSHPWQAQRITDEVKIKKEYGLKNKKEIWKAQSLLREWQARARSVIGLTSAHKEAEQRILIGKMQKLGVIGEKADIDAILGLSLRDVLDHRLQTKIYKMGLAITQKQARQFITHRKIMVNDNIIDSPIYFVKATDTIAYRSEFTPKLIVIVSKKEEPKEEVVDGK